MFYNEGEVSIILKMVHPVIRLVSAMDVRNLLKKHYGLFKDHQNVRNFFGGLHCSEQLWIRGRLGLGLFN